MENIGPVAIKSVGHYILEVENCLKKCNLTSSDIDFFIPHQADNPNY